MSTEGTRRFRPPPRRRTARTSGGPIEAMGQGPRSGMAAQLRFRRARKGAGATTNVPRAGGKKAGARRVGVERNAAQRLPFAGRYAHQRLDADRCVSPLAIRERTVTAPVFTCASPE